MFNAARCVVYRECKFILVFFLDYLKEHPIITRLNIY